MLLSCPDQNIDATGEKQPATCGTHFRFEASSSTPSGGSEPTSIAEIDMSSLWSATLELTSGYPSKLISTH